MALKGLWMWYYSIKKTMEVVLWH